MKRKQITGALLGFALLAVLIFGACENSVSVGGDSPEAPRNLRIVRADRQLTLSWDAAAGADSYAVYYGDGESTGRGALRPENSGENLELTGRNALIRGLANGTRYYLWVKAENAFGAAFSTVVSGIPGQSGLPPTQPGNLRLTELNGRLLAAWDAAEEAVSYQVWVGTSSVFGDAQMKAEIPYLSASLGGLTNDTLYYVWVVAKNQEGETRSDPVEGRPGNGAVFEDLEGLGDYLTEQPINTGAEPYIVGLKGFDLSGADDPLGQILAVLKGRAVALDLSECTGSSIANITATVSNARFNRNKLVACILPDSLTSIGNYAFSGCSSLVSVDLPAGLTTIGNYAFLNCSSLASVDLSAASLTTTGTNTFEGCISLTSVELPASLTSIGTSVFSNCSSLASTDLPDGIKSIGNYVFSNCSSLASIDLPDALETIGAYAFQNCSFVSVDLPAGLTSIGTYTFRDCSFLTSITLPPGLTTIGTYTFYGCTSLTSIALPPGITTIGTYAFYGCSSLVSLVLPGALTTVGDYAFYGCSSLVSVSLPASLTSLGSRVFNRCPWLKIGVSAGNPSYSSNSEGALLSKDGKTIVAWPSAAGALTIPPGVARIEDYAFYASGITSLTLPGTIGSMGDYTFAASPDLTSVTLKNGVLEIGDRAFADCRSLTTINFPPVGSGGKSSLRRIGYNAFLNCHGLTQVIIPEGVTFMGVSGGGSSSTVVGSFEGCTGLTHVDTPSTLFTATGFNFGGFKSCVSLVSVTVRCTTPPPSSYTSEGFTAFVNTNSTFIVYVPAESVELYKDKTTTWGTVNIEAIPESQ